MTLRGIKSMMVSALLLSVPVSAMAQENYSLSLEEAQQLAIERNRTLQNSALDIRAAHASKWAAIANMLPQVNATADYSNYCGYVMDFSGMKIAMPPYVDFGVNTSVTFGGALVVSVKIQEIAQKMSDISFQQSELQLSEQVKTLYFSALISQEVVSLLNANLESINRLHEMTLKSVEVGVAEQTAADQIMVQAATLSNSLNSANRSLEMIYNSLRLQLCLDVNDGLELTEGLEDLLATNTFLALTDENFDVKSNYGYQLAEKNAELSRQQYNAAKWQCTPTLTAFHQYSAKKYLSDEKTMNMTPPNMIGLKLSIPIFSSLGKTKSVQAARISYDKSLNTLTDTEQQLLVQHRQLCYNLNSTYEAYNTQKKNLEVTRKVFDNIAKKYEHGYSSAMDLTQTTTTLLSAQSSYIQSLMEFINAQVEFEKLLNK